MPTACRSSNDALQCSDQTPIWHVVLSALAPVPQKVKTAEQAQRTFMSAMSDSGLKPTVVYHNLSPAELYEKVCRSFQALPASPSNFHLAACAQ